MTDEGSGRFVIPHTSFLIVHPSQWEMQLMTLLRRRPLMLAAFHRQNLARLAPLIDAAAKSFVRHSRLREQASPSTSWPR